jgi:hypothetical protein
MPCVTGSMKEVNAGKCTRFADFRRLLGKVSLAAQFPMSVFPALSTRHHSILTVKLNQG